MIGGEFPIKLTDVQNAVDCRPLGPDVYAYSSGRAALYQILKFLKEQKQITHVLLPDYLCSTILVPIHKLGLSYSFFPLNEGLELESEKFQEVYKRDAAVLLINYFGLQDLSEQIAVIRNNDINAIIIEDDVQAYYEFIKPLGDVDFKYTSLRKTFAIPDGGLVKTNYPLPVVEEQNSFGQYKAAAALMKAMRDGNFDDSVYLNISKLGGSKIDDELHLGMTSISKRLYASVNEEEVKSRRVNNAQFLAERIADMGIKPLLPIFADKVPLFVPITLTNRDEVRCKMFECQIFCPVHWPTDEEKAKKGLQLARTELSLIVDQRYGLKDMDEILSCI